jgi:hypothetical protein
MAKLNKKLIMMGLSTILIPLGKLILKKIVRKGIDKLDSNGGDDVKDKLVSTTQQFEGKA